MSTAGRVDDSIGKALQARVVAGDRSALSPLYCECRYIASLLCRSISKKKSIPITPERLTEVAHDAATRLVERIMRNHGYRVNNFRSMLYYEVLHALTPNNGNGEPEEEELREDLVATPTLAPQPDPKEYLRDLLDAHDDGWRVVYDLARARHFSEAVRRIVGYTGRGWVERRVAKMLAVYNTLRVRP